MHVKIKRVTATGIRVVGGQLSTSDIIKQAGSRRERERERDKKKLKKKNADPTLKCDFLFLFF